MQPSVVQVSRGATCSALPCIKAHNGFADHLLSSVGAAVVRSLDLPEHGTPNLAHDHDVFRTKAAIQIMYSVAHDDSSFKVESSHDTHF